MWLFSCTPEDPEDNMVKEKHHAKEPYSTSLHAPKYILKYTSDCTQLHTPILLDCTLSIALYNTHPARLTQTLKYALLTLPNTLPGVLSRILPMALDGTLPAWLIVHSQVSSHGALKYTAEQTPQSTLN